MIATIILRRLTQEKKCWLWLSSKYQEKYILMLLFLQILKPWPTEENSNWSKWTAGTAASTTARRSTLPRAPRPSQNRARSSSARALAREISSSTSEKCPRSPLLRARKARASIFGTRMWWSTMMLVKMSPFLVRYVLTGNLCFWGGVLS